MTSLHYVSPGPVSAHQAAGCHGLRVSVEQDVLHEADQAPGQQLREHVDPDIGHHVRGLLLLRLAICETLSENVYSPSLVVDDPEKAVKVFLSFSCLYPRPAVSGLASAENSPRGSAESLHSPGPASATSVDVSSLRISLQ